MVETAKKTKEDKTVPKARGRPRKVLKTKEKVKLPKETKKGRPGRPKKPEKTRKRKSGD